VAEAPIHLDARNGDVLPGEVYAEMEPWIRDLRPYTGAVHELGLKARKAVEQARERVAALIGAPNSDEIHFTANATEAANLGLKGLLKSWKRHGKRVLTSTAEHPAVDLCLADAELEWGLSVDRLPVDPDGRLDPEKVDGAWSEEVILLATHLANHDLGTIQPFRELAGTANSRGLPFFLDASTGGGWIPVDVAASGISAMTLAPYRFGGPAGAGILYASSRARVKPVLFGGNQQGGLRPGHENLAAIVGAGKAAELAIARQQAETVRLGSLTGCLWKEISKALPEAVLNGPEPGERRLGNHLSFSIPSVDGEAVALRASLKGLYLHAGAACVSRSMRIPASLKAIGADETRARGMLMLTPGYGFPEGQVDKSVQRLKDVVDALKAESF